jgi:hypothetical protein
MTLRDTTDNENARLLTCHSRAGGNPPNAGDWIPACAGMTCN